MAINHVLPPLRNKPYGGAWSIHDPESVVHLKNINHEIGDSKKFLQDYKEWICSGKNFQGIQNFGNIDFSAGTTETFGQFYHQHINKRLRLLKGEFFYHWLMGRNYFKSCVDIGDDKLKSGDVVVMSCPFSGTGNIPVDFYSILEQCEQLEIPVMLDLAYISISKIEELDLSFKCIHTITTSLSKVFPVEHHRIGIRMRRQFFDDTLFAYNQNDYVNLFSVNIGHQMIKKFSNNWLYEKYKDLQKDSCASLQLTPSDCVIFGLDTAGKYSEYNRGIDTNRLCFSRIWDKRITI
tara:strand:+ start:452 stop:1330 length:879 start_codon:yes stop_codon:yes gene_type:complete